MNGKCDLCSGKPAVERTNGVVMCDNCAYGVKDNVEHVNSNRDICEHGGDYNMEDAQ